MTADLDRPVKQPDRRCYARRSGHDRRMGSRQRRRSDRVTLIPVDDEDEVRRRMLGRSEDSRLRHVVQPGPERVIPFDEVEDRPLPLPLLVRWWALLRGLGSRR